jgi:predicted lipoprotein with Yx(FWY)xxD motif
MWAVASLAAAPLLIAGCHSGSSAASAPSKAPAKAAGKAPSKAASKAGSPAPGAAASAQQAVLKTKKTKIGTVLTNAEGDTLYWSTKDTTAKSDCTATCASLWPALEGKPEAAPGTMLTGLSTIHGMGGAVQITYKGHPLYTYKSDAPGDTKGADVPGWHAATTSTPTMK